MKAVFLALTMLFIAGSTTQPIKHAAASCGPFLAKRVNELGQPWKTYSQSRQPAWLDNQTKQRRGYGLLEIKPRGKHFAAIDFYYDHAFLQHPLRKKPAT